VTVSPPGPRLSGAGEAPVAPAVDVQGLWRGFGATSVLEGLDFTAQYGEVTGLVGPNGAGKTTLLLVLATLLAPDQGSVRIGGYDPVDAPGAVRAHLGWVPDAMGFYDNLTAAEYLVFAGTARRMTKREAADRAAELLDLVHLSEFAARPVHVLSRGQKQRLGMASALVHRPAVLVLDEPTAGLDPTNRAEFLALVRHLATDGASVIVSSHLLSDLEEIADQVAFIDQGRSVGTRRTGEHRASTAQRRWRIHALDERPMWAALHDLGIAADGTGPGGAVVTFDSDEAAATTLTRLVDHGVAVVSFAPVSTSLEAAYFELTERR
jgi:ABC-2 type transport system ATP-binding protein